MNGTEFKPLGINEIDKCATIYRVDSATFIYVCFHCGESYNDNESVLHHIESHFQLVSVTVDEIHLESESKASLILSDAQNERIYVLPEPDFKKEIMESEDLNDVDPERKDLVNTNDTLADTIDVMSEPDNIDILSESMKTEAVRNDEDESMPVVEKTSNLYCKICDTYLTNPTKLAVRSHLLRFHFKEKSFKCIKCAKSFMRISALETHLNLHIEFGDVDWNCAGDGIWKPLHVEWPESHDSFDRSSDVFEIKSTDALPKKKKRLFVKNPQIQNFYKCHKCPETYSTTGYLKNHFNSHETDEILQINGCRLCESYYRSEVDLRLHVLEEHFSSEKLKCSACSFECPQSDRISFDKHLQVHLKKKTVAWKNVVDGISNQGNDLTSYVEVITYNEEPFPCDLCTEKFYLKSNLDVHTKSEHSKNEREMHCPTCKAIFTRLKFYFAHQFEHQRVGETVTETDINKLNDNLNSYIEEQIVCNETEDTSNPYKCLICTRQFSNIYEIRRHVRETHIYRTLPKPIKPNLKLKLPCHICGTVVKQVSMSNHLSTHSDVKLFACAFCGKKFHKNPSKEIHERTHTGEKPFQCEQCGKKFFSHALMTAHKKCHDDTKYPCTICGRAFNVPSSYRRHLKTHSKERQFDCTICSKAFNTRIYLTRHMFSHSEKTFQCQFCDDKFNTANGKRQHEKSKHNYEPT